MSLLAMPAFLKIIDEILNPTRSLNVSREEVAITAHAARGSQS